MPGVLRGMHYHLRQADLWVPIEGQATVGLCDLRRGSPADRRASTVELEPGLALYLPPGIAHGFFARTPFTMLYLVDRAYDGSDEHGFSPLDPALGIDWPAADVVLSERDRTASSLADALVATPVDPWVG